MGVSKPTAYISPRFCSSIVINELLRKKHSPKQEGIVLYNGDATCRPRTRIAWCTGPQHKHDDNTDTNIIMLMMIMMLVIHILIILMTILLIMTTTIMIHIINKAQS